MCFRDGSGIGRDFHAKAASDSSKKMVFIDEIDTYLEERWEFATTLPNNKVIVKFPP